MKTKKTHNCWVNGKDCMIITGSMFLLFSSFKKILDLKKTTKKNTTKTEKTRKTSKNRNLKIVNCFLLMLVFF